MGSYVFYCCLANIYGATNNMIMWVYMHAVRYKQRFQNYDNSFLLLKASIMIEKPSIIEEAGVI